MSVPHVQLTGIFGVPGPYGSKACVPSFVKSVTKGVFSCASRKCSISLFNPIGVQDFFCFRSAFESSVANEARTCCHSTVSKCNGDKVIYFFYASGESFMTIKDHSDWQSHFFDWYDDGVSLCYIKRLKIRLNFTLQL